jgi:serine/threonine protein kinase
MIAAGTTLDGRYRLERALARGGFAQVYLATHLGLRRQVAVKVLDPGLVAAAGGDAFLVRFADEAALLARLAHPHILGVHDYGEAAGTAYLVLPYVAGGTLHDRLRRGPLAPAAAAAYLAQAAAALDYAYERHRLVHRDVKPQNLLLDGDERLLLADFGIAKLLADTSSRSVTGVVGTLAYMAPEQFEGRVGRATDVYALGCVAFQLLAGAPPYTGPTEQVIYGHVSAPVPDIVARSAGRAPAALRPVLARALAKRPDERYERAGALAAAFAAALAAPAPAAPTMPGPPVPRDTAPGPRRPATPPAETTVAAPMSTPMTAPDTVARPTTPSPEGPLPPTQALQEPVLRGAAPPTVEAERVPGPHPGGPTAPAIAREGLPPSPSAAAPRPTVRGTPGASGMVVAPGTPRSRPLVLALLAALAVALLVGGGVYVVLGLSQKPPLDFPFSPTVLDAQYATALARATTRDAGAALFAFTIDGDASDSTTDRTTYAFFLPRTNQAVSYEFRGTGTDSAYEGSPEQYPSARDRVLKQPPWRAEPAYVAAVAAAYQQAAPLPLGAHYALSLATLVPTAPHEYALTFSYAIEGRYLLRGDRYPDGEDDHYYLDGGQVTPGYRESQRRRGDLNEAGRIALAVASIGIVGVLGWWWRRRGAARG